MPATPLDDRRREVLRALIQLHVDTGEPVGSESLSRALRRALSPATLRNIMADLEALGYLDHPHTSAGRVPTDEGYRVYVDTLVGRGRSPPATRQRIESELRSADASAEQTMERASHLLSRLSRHVGFVLAPDIARASFRHVDLVPLAHPRILVVMVSSTGLVTHKVIEVEEQLSPTDLQACANYLNAHFAGMTLAAIRSRLLELMQRGQGALRLAAAERAWPSASGPSTSRTARRASTSTARRTSWSSPSSRTWSACARSSGRSRRRAGWCGSSTPASSGDGIRVLIGHENPDPELQDLSLVTASCRVEGEAGFGLGVLGSTRMEYAHVVSLVDHVARAVSEVLRGNRA